MTIAIEERCKQKGVKLTDQRKLIAQIMSDARDHPNVDELYKRVSKIDSKISIATVYRTVKLFEESGIINKLNFENNQAVYELSNVEHHDHLVCVKCNIIIEFQDDVIERHQLQIANKYDFQLTDHSLYLYGLCKNCKESL